MSGRSRPWPTRDGWISTALAYVKEQDTLSAKRLEFAKAKTNPPSPTLQAPAAKEQLTRKQLRAKQWAEKKANGNVAN